ncbi:MAG: sterol desaturase family protein [Stanieria sp.]
MSIINILLVAFLLLLIGDFLSTFFYHVPEHVFGKFHTLVHHGKNRSFIHYAVLTKNPLVLLDGMVGALPYFIFIPWLWQISPLGTLLGLILGELHVVWRHVSIINWQTPKAIQFCCRLFFITTPERHWLHHQNASLAYGDIFTFYDYPARLWLKFLSVIKTKLQKIAYVSKA